MKKIISWFCLMLPSLFIIDWEVVGINVANGSYTIAFAMVAKYILINLAIVGVVYAVFMNKNR